jgi:hypothetical protein
MKTPLFTVALVVGLAACGEKPQTLVSTIQDGAAYTGTGKAFVSPDWKPGDKGSWESHLKARGQYGQNDYSRTQ